MSFVKVRNTRAQSAAFGKHARQRAARNRGKGRRATVAGQYDYLKLGEIPIWLRFALQSYDFKTWDRELKEVVDVVDSPWYEYASHYYPKKRRTIICSAGPYRKDPCYPCSIEAIYWDDHREKEEEVRKAGITDVKIERNPPMRRGIRNAMAVLGVDDYFEIPLLDKDGKIRKSATGDVLKRYVAEPCARLPKGTKYPIKNGHNMNWSFPGTHLEQLQSFNRQLENVCANCATPLFASTLVCANCQHVEEDFGTAIEGEDLIILQDEKVRCSNCHSEDVIPNPECSGCGDAESGGLMSFDIRLKAEPAGENKTDLKMVGYRLPNYNEDLTHLYQNPLDIVKIFAPTPLNLQKTILGDIAEDIDPSFGAFTEGYSSSDDDSEQEGVPF